MTTFNWLQIAADEFLRLSPAASEKAERLMNNLPRGLRADPGASGVVELRTPDGSVPLKILVDGPIPTVVGVTEE